MKQRIGYTRRLRVMKKRWGHPCRTYADYCETCNAWAVFRKGGESRVTRWGNRAMLRACYGPDISEMLNEE